MWQKTKEHLVRLCSSIKMNHAFTFVAHVVMNDENNLVRFFFVMPDKTRGRKLFILFIYF